MAGLIALAFFTVVGFAGLGVGIWRWVSQEFAWRDRWIGSLEETLTEVGRTEAIAKRLMEAKKQRRRGLHLLAPVPLVLAVAEGARRHKGVTGLILAAAAAATWGLLDTSNRDDDVSAPPRQSSSTTVRPRSTTTTTSTVVVVVEPASAPAVASSSARGGATAGDAEVMPTLTTTTTTSAPEASTTTTTTSPTPVIQPEQNCLVGFDLPILRLTVCI